MVFVFRKLLNIFNMSVKNGNIDKPMVVILGATGTGKTKLSVEIASKYNGEVINSDAMQMYNGLNIITNKATKEERKGIPHHLIGIIDPAHKSTVIEYRDKALQIINSLHEQKKLPIIVGGTNYYLESILFDAMSGHWEEEYVNSNAKVGDTPYDGVDMLKSFQCSDQSDLRKRVHNVLISEESTSNDIYEMLEEVDPKGASEYHNNDVRKLRRSLGVWMKTGRRLSDIYTQQQEASGGKALGGNKRFENVLILWLQAEKETLKTRLLDRVKDMMYRGLLEEVEQFHDHYNKNFLKEGIKYSKCGLPVHYQEGIFQAIGFKEFHPYLILEQAKRDSKVGRKRYEQAIQLMTERTYRYVKLQKRWIETRLIMKDRLHYPLYGLDSTEPDKWNTVITARVDKIMEAFLEGGKIPFQPETVEDTDDAKVYGDKTRYSCEDCGSILIGKFQYDAHMAGSRHSKVLQRKARLLQMQNASEGNFQTAPEKIQAGDS